MDFQQLIAYITPEIYENLKRAIELGKWSNGVRLTREQLEHSMQAIIAYEEKHIAPNERTGYVPPKPKSAEACDIEGHTHGSPDDELPIKWH